MIPIIVSTIALNLLCCHPADSIVGASSVTGDSFDGGHIERVPPRPPSSPASYLPPIRTSPFLWGAQGHPLRRSGAYTTLHDQFAYLDSLRVTFYRVDVHVDTVRNDVVAGAASFAAVLDTAERHGIHVLPVFIDRPDITGQFGERSVELNRRAGYQLGHVFTAKYGNRVAYIEAGNELDRRSILPAHEGGDLSDYDRAKLARITAFLRGLTQGMHSAAPDVKVIVNVNGWEHYGFFEALDRDSVDYDIAGVHVYTEPSAGDVTMRRAMAAVHDKDIWLTEIDRWGGSYRESPASTQADWIRQHARRYYGIERIKAFFVYELFDEPIYLGTPLAPEAYYGLVACLPASPQCPAKRLKPAFDAYRYSIEELDHGYEDYVSWLFARLLQRAPSLAELSGWAERLRVQRVSEERGRLERPGAPTVIDGILQLNTTAVVNQQYEQLLGRPPSQDESARWVRELSDGAPGRALVEELCSSNEFWMLSGGTNMGFVDRLYRMLLQRVPDAGGRASFLHALDNGSTRRDVVTSILKSSEYYRLFVETKYKALYGRLPSAEERDRHVARLQAGLTEEEWLEEMLTSKASWDAAIKDGYWSRIRERRD